MCFLGLLFQTQVQGGRLFCSTRVSGKTGTWKELDEAGRMWNGDLLARGTGDRGGGRRGASGPVRPLPALRLRSPAPVLGSERRGCLKTGVG